jgi:ABC-type branched-subunit amino acid transport system ATPase component
MSLEIRNVTQEFGGVRALDDVTISVATGEVMGLIGPNGSGKSTLLNAVTGHVRPTKGEILWRDIPLIGRAPGSATRAGVVRTFQDARLFETESVFINLLWAAEAHRWRSSFSELRDLVAPRHVDYRERCESMLEQFELTPWRDVAVSNCSGGTRNLLSVVCAALARTGDPEDYLFLFDEPFGGIEEGAIGMVAEKITSLAKDGSTVVIVDHRLDHLRVSCSRLAVLDLGGLLAFGATEEVLRKPEVVRAYVGEQR